MKIVIGGTAIQQWLDYMLLEVLILWCYFILSQKKMFEIFFDIEHKQPRNFETYESWSLTWTCKKQRGNKGYEFDSVYQIRNDELLDEKIAWIKWISHKKSKRETNLDEK